MATSIFALTDRPCKQYFDPQLETLHCDIVWAFVPHVLRGHRKNVINDVKRLRFEEEYNGIITSKRDAARNANEGLNWVWWERCMADEELRAYMRAEGYRAIRDVVWLIEHYPSRHVSQKALELKPAAFDSLREKLVAEEAKHVPDLPVYANPPILKSSLPELAARIGCDLQEYILLLETHDKIDEDGDVLFPEEASEKFMRLFPNYKPQTSQRQTE